MKTRNLALNINWQDEDVATDQVFSDVLAIDNGSTSAQIFVGRKSLFTSAHSMKTDLQFVNCLEDKIRQWEL